MISLRFASALKGFGLGLLGLSTFTAFLSSSVPKAQAFTDADFRISVANDTRFVVDVKGDSIPGNGGPMQIHRKTTEFQRKSSTFYGEYDSKAGSYEIHLRENPNLCLATSVGLNYNSMNEGTSVVVTINCKQANNWIYSNGQLKVSRKQELCLDIAWGKIENYSALQVARCKPGHPAQTFNIERNGGGQVNNPQPVVNNPPPVPQPQPQPVVKPAAPTPVVQPPVFNESGVGGKAVGFILGAIASNASGLYYGTLTDVYGFSLSPSEQYKRTDSWPWTDAYYYRQHMNKLACAQKFEAKIKATGQYTLGPVILAHTVFNQDGSDFRCSYLINKDVVNQMKIDGKI
jgi:hypothetical protein